MVQFPPKFMTNGTILTVSFPFLDGDVPRRTSYGIYIFQLVRLARASSNLSDFNCRSKALTAKLLRQNCRYFKLRKCVFEILSQTQFIGRKKYKVGLKTLLLQCLSEPDVYGNFAYRFRNIVRKSNFSEQFRKLN